MKLSSRYAAALLEHLPLACSAWAVTFVNCVYWEVIAFAGVILGELGAVAEA